MHIILDGGTGNEPAHKCSAPRFYFLLLWLFVFLSTVDIISSQFSETTALLRSPQAALLKSRTKTCAVGMPFMHAITWLPVLIGVASITGCLTCCSCALLSPTPSATQTRAQRDKSFASGTVTLTLTRRQRYAAFASVGVGRLGAANGCKALGAWLASIPDSASWAQFQREVGPTLIAAYVPQNRNNWYLGGGRKPCTTQFPRDSDSVWRWDGKAPALQHAFYNGLTHTSGRCLQPGCYFLAGQPDNSRGDECWLSVMLTSPTFFGWNDVRDDNPYTAGYVCEYPEPPTPTQSLVRRSPIKPSVASPSVSTSVSVSLSPGRRYEPALPASCNTAGDPSHCSYADAIPIMMIVLICLAVVAIATVVIACQLRWRCAKSERCTSSPPSTQEEGDTPMLEYPLSPLCNESNLSTLCTQYTSCLMLHPLGANRVANQGSPTSIANRGSPTSIANRGSRTSIPKRRVPLQHSSPIMTGMYHWKDDKCEVAADLDAREVYKCEKGKDDVDDTVLL